MDLSSLEATRPTTNIFQQIKEVFHGVIDQGNKLSSISENNPQYEKFRL